MQAPIKYKDVEVAGRKFRIKKFSARVGSFMILKLTTILAPLFSSFKVDPNVKSPEDIEIGDINITGIMNQLTNISEKDFNYIQEQALRVCFEHLPAGLSPVLNENGTFGVEDLEDNTAAVMALTVHALAFNLTSFFQESGLQGLVADLISSRQG